MFKCLWGRCKSDLDRSIVSLIAKLHLEQRLIVGDRSFRSGRGVAKGSLLSPSLFNVYLDTALQSSELLSQCIRRGELLAFADDIIFQAATVPETKSIIREFEKL